jgi:signal transduction histidine kinase
MFPAIEVRRRSSDLRQRERADAVVEEQLAHMARLVTDLADASRIARGAVDLQCQRLDLRSAIVQALDLISSQLQRRQHVVTVDLTQEPLWVFGDPTRLKQIFSNLLQNATTYTPHGGAIAASAAAADGHAVFRVRDNGVGIAADSLDRIFRLFERGQHDSSSVSLGVGLAVVRRLVELHGGTVSAFSDGPNRGSEFVVKLPLTSHTA